ncbi:AAA family ATPase [Acidithiobacillus ferrooxidans F221]|uniref:ATP-binding protein n=1 Tax=Acidithiobacillus ferrooxidans TaxID=920 RepID=UPI001C064C87|nr:ATP-binding protein [Acidithiobacillus ferrooxidans]MBU2809615.1 AAA family ATPase [Acidithiobacillus ferrooxidans F221]
MSPPAVAPPPALRLASLKLDNFRAFPEPETFNLEGKNLLVYGENGSGKSSIFAALRALFRHPSPPPALNEKHAFENKFKQPQGEPWSVDAVFTNGKTVTWANTGLQGDKPLRDEIALKAAMLDYRALMETNHLHGEDRVNLFDVIVNTLLAGYGITSPGVAPFPTSGTAQVAISDYWATLQRVRERIGMTTTGIPTYILQSCQGFNAGLNVALSAVNALLPGLLHDLKQQDMLVKPLSFPGLVPHAEYWLEKRQYEGKTIWLEVDYRGEALQHPHLFLNEARLSALGLAIYLAGRLALVQQATGDAPKLLVLDDVLIGIDHSNRLPVLDVLQKHFADWQVVLLTHDKTWFDLARERLPKDDWACCEVYEGDPAATAPMPIVRPTKNEPARALLQKANDLLVNLGYVEAAANYARQAFEMGVRIAAQELKIKMEYRLDPAARKAQDFLDKLKSWQGTANVPRADWKAATDRLGLLKNVVMNPYSHPSAPNIPKQEVADAIAAVTVFLDLVARR